MHGPRRLLLIGLLGVLAIFIVRAMLRVFVASRFGVDVEIPLRAAERWLAGQPPYLADAFSVRGGATLPFLYPPFTLPFLAGLTELPRTLVDAVVVAAMVVSAIVACRRLSIPWLWLPLFLVWPPFAEGIAGGNLQIALFAAYVYLFFAPGGVAWSARPRDIGEPTTSGLMVGGLATVIGAVKVSQPHAWVYALRHRPRPAIIGLVVAVLLTALTLALTGTALWRSWVAQLRLASDPAWASGGIALSRYLPSGVGLAIAIVCLAAVPFVPWRSAGAWIGLLSVVGTLSLHVFGLLFLLPAMLVIRREIALVVAILVTTYRPDAIWIAVLICTTTFAASTRWPDLRERSSRSPEPTPA
jgi:hypothetical protein